MLDDEPHFKWQPAHRLAIYERSLEWFQFWLMHTMNCDPAKDAQVSVDTILETAPVLEEKPVVPDTASYRLAIKPWGTVYVDGKEKGVSPPLKKLVLPAGKHKIRIANPGFPDYFMDVNLSKGKTGTIDYDFAARSK